MNTYRERVRKMLQGFEVQIEKDYCMFEIEDICMASMGDTHFMIRSMLSLGKRAGERSAQRKSKADIKEYELQIRSDKSEISKLKRENKKLQRELKKLGETA